MNKIEIIEIAKFTIDKLLGGILGLMIFAFIFRLVNKWIDCKTDFSYGGNDIKINIDVCRKLSRIEETLNFIKKDIDSKNSIRKSAADYIDEINKFKAREAKQPVPIAISDIVKDRDCKSYAEVAKEAFKATQCEDICKKIDERFPTPSSKKKKPKNSKRK